MEKDDTIYCFSAFWKDSLFVCVILNLDISEILQPKTYVGYKDRSIHIFSVYLSVYLE